MIPYHLVIGKATRPPGRRSSVIYSYHLPLCYRTFQESYAENYDAKKVFIIVLFCFAPVITSDFATQYEETISAQ